MSTEYVFPFNNEAEFVKIAQKLGIKKIIFLYDEKDFLSADKKLKEIESNIDMEKGLLLNKQNPNVKSKIIVVKSSDKDRMLMDSKSANIFYGFEDLPRKDFMHQRASGLNQILCDIAKRNNIIIGFPYSFLLKENRTIISGRMIQNFKLCKKFKVKTLIASFTDNPYELRSPHDVSSLFRVLGFNN